MLAVSLSRFEVDERAGCSTQKEHRFRSECQVPVSRTANINLSRGETQEGPTVLFGIYRAYQRRLIVSEVDMLMSPTSELEVGDVKDID